MFTYQFFKGEHPNWKDLLAMTHANGLMTTSADSICGKVCKNLRGLKIHQTKMACLRSEQVTLTRQHVPDLIQNPNISLVLA